ncbi:MAG: hypothetical protein ACREQ5_02785, partial [Candidatus Dormibacteria bacterium]
MKFVIHDYETASSCDLKHAGAWRYGEDPTTEILCLGVMDDEGNSEVYSGNDLAFEDHKQRQSLLYRAWVDPKVFFIAHNCAFEKSIWRNLMTDWPVIPNERYHDTQAACAMKGLPLKLERAAMALHLEAQKDMEGSRVTLSLSRPNKKGFLDRSPDKLARVRTYNLADLDAEVALHRRVRGLGESERQVWLLDQRINERGVRLDTSFIDASQSIVAQATGPLLTEFRALTGVNPTQRDKFMAWLHENGCA